MFCKSNILNLTKLKCISTKAAKTPEIINCPKKLITPKKFKLYFESAPHLLKVQQYVPTDCLTQKKYGMPKTLHLVDSKVAKDIVKRIIGLLKIKQEHLICEMSPGLGLVTAELLRLGVPRIRLFESRLEFMTRLELLSDKYPGKIEIFNKDLNNLHHLIYIDQNENETKVQQFLRDIPNHKWADDPVMTVIGTMPSLTFVRYLCRDLAQQSHFAKHGRVQMFVLLKKDDFMKLTANPDTSNLLIYRSISVLFNTFFKKCELLGRYPRKAFMPWEKSKQIQYPNCDYENLYLVRINMKKTFALPSEQFYSYYYFVTQFFTKCKARVIPTLENFIPGIGVDIIAAKPMKKFPRNMSIYTIFGELHPEEILSLFKLVVNHPSYKGSRLEPMIEAQSLKDETVDSDLADAVPSITEDLEEKLLPYMDR